MSYTVRYTDTSKQPIIVEDQTVNDTALDVTLFGRIDLEYGEELNEDMLHIMERFACPQNSASTPTDTYPDYAINGNSLTHPTVGQLWYNSTVKKPFVWNGIKWESIRLQGNIAGNWGQILDGSQIPRPVNPANGYVYQYSECIWAVAPASIPTAFTYMAATTDNNGFVTMKYRAYGDSALTSGIANYLIIAIAGNTNYGSINVTPATPFVSGTPTPTPTISISVTPSITPTKTPSPSVTPTTSATPAVSATPVPTPTRTQTPTPSATPPVSNTPTPSVTPTPSPFVDSCTTCTTEGLQCCVAVNSFLPDGMIAGDIRPGHNMVLADQKTLEPGVGTVTYSEPSLQPAVRVVTKSGISLVCSTTAPLPTPEGLVDAPFVMGKQVATFKNGQAHWEDVVSVTDVGDTWVQHITVGDKCFWAGEQSNGFILHHNIKCCYCDPSTCPGGVWQPPNCCMC